MAEHLIVVQAVEGSSPFVHPTKLEISARGKRVFCFDALLPCLRFEACGQSFKCALEATFCVCECGGASQ